MKIKQLFFGIVLFANFLASAQCFEIESILVDACGSPEGENEMVRFKVGNADLCANDLTVNWANPGNSWLGLAQNATTAQIVSDLNATIISCGFLLEPTSCVLPANSTVLLITSTAIDITANSFANLTDTMYVIFQNAGNTAGHFANYNSSGGLRTLTMNFSNPVGCTDQVTYDRGNLVNINGVTGGTSAQKNGSTVNFDSAGNPTYINNGCQAPFNPFLVDLTATEVTSGTTIICPGDVIQVSANVIGSYQEIIWTGFNGNFDAQDVTTTNYNSVLADNIDFYIYVGVVTICNDTIKDSVLFTINSSPTVSNAGPYTTFSGTQQMTSTMSGGVWSSNCGACINSTTGVFDPSISGEGTFQICHTAGCGQDCINIIVNDNCTMTWTVTSSNPTCFQDNDGDVTINVSGIVGNANYIITNSNNTQVNNSNSSGTANNLPAGWYYFSVTDNLCTIIDSVLITEPNDLIVNYTVNNPNCYGIADGIAFIDTVQNYQGSYNDIVYQWSQGALGVDLVVNDSLYNIGENNYFITVTDSAGCTDVLNFNVTYPDSLYFNNFTIKPAICRNQVPFDNGNAQVSGSASGGSNGNGQGVNISYVWTNATTGFTYNQGTTITNLNPGQYTLTATNDLGCIISETITVDSLSPEASFTLTSNDFTSNYEGTAVVNIDLTNTSTNYALSQDPNVDTVFIWTFGFEGESPFVTANYTDIISQKYIKEGEYEICLKVIENFNGCVDSTCQTITVHDLPKLDIPNVFTPNGDGINDEFFFPSNAIVEFSCLVFDRWGKKVFEFASITDKWNGKHFKNQKTCADGVYFYIYNATSSNGTTFKGQGNIHLVSGDK